MRQSRRTPVEFSLEGAIINILLWIIQILLALLFLFTGGYKLVLPTEELERMAPPNQIYLPGLFLKFIGVCEVLGALGLVLPGLLGIRKGLTALAATALVIIMIGAVIITAAAGDLRAAILTVVVGLLCAFVAYERGVKRVGNH